MSKRLSYFLAILTVIAFITFVVFRQTSEFRLSAFEGYEDIILTGVLNTIWVSLLSLLGSVVLGFIFYLFSISKSKYLVAMTDIIREIIYGTPLLVLVVITAFVIGPAFGSYQRNVLGISALIVYMTPYMMNVYQSAFSSISNEQYMAMDLFGFNSFQRYRYIIIPQVIRILMPPMMNNFSMIVKGSALLNVLSFNELYFAVITTQSKNFAFMEGYMIMWILYLAFTIPLSQLAKFVERKWSL